MSIDLARRHYEAGDAESLVARIERALAACGPGPIDPAALAFAAPRPPSPRASASSP